MLKRLISQLFDRFTLTWLKTIANSSWPIKNDHETLRKEKLSFKSLPEQPADQQLILLNYKQIKQDMPYTKNGYKVVKMLIKHQQITMFSQITDHIPKYLLARELKMSTIKFT